MRCLICDSPTKYYLSKTYAEPPMSEMMIDIGTVDYHRRTLCGFTLSKTHAELETERWEKLNSDFHHYLENRGDDAAQINQPPYLQQALMLSTLERNHVLSFDSSLDYAGGYGTLSTVLLKYFDLKLSVYDPFVQHAEGANCVATADLGRSRSMELLMEQWGHRSSRYWKGH